MSSARKNVGLALEGTSRDAVVASLARAGYEVHIAVNADRVRSLVARDVVDAWIFDARSDDILDLLLSARGFLLPADNIPSPADHRAFLQWSEALITQLEVALLGDASERADRWDEVRGVWLLAGSAGATGAIQAFLSAFRQPPPIAFLYGQHLVPGQQYQLRGFSAQNEAFSLRFSEGVNALEPGRVLMISPRCKMKLGEFGQVISTREPWEGQHTPDINEILVILSAAKLPSPGVIVFSGMGNDGSGALKLFEAAGGRVWAQSTSSAVCPAMPQAAIDTGLVQLSGDPKTLAEALERLYGP